MNKTFFGQNTYKVDLAPLPENTVLVGICTYVENADEFHAILQLAKPTDMTSDGNYNTLTPVTAPYDMNVVEEITRVWPFYGYPIAFNTTEFSGTEFRNFLFTGDTVVDELDAPVDLFNGITGDPKNLSLAVFAASTFTQGSKYSEESVIYPGDWDQMVLESDLIIRRGSSMCHFVISDASSYMWLQNIISYPNEGFFMVFTESEYFDSNMKLFAQDISTLNTTIYSVGATILTGGMHKYTCQVCGYVTEQASMPTTPCPQCKQTNWK